MLEQTDKIRFDRLSGRKSARIYDDGFLRVEYENYYVSCGNKQLKFSQTNFLIVAILVKNLGEYVTADAVWKQLWSGRKPLNPESLRVYIHRLRQALSPFNIQIETKPGTGYRLIPAGH